MCTIILAHDVFEKEILASNRDEKYKRTFTPPRKIHSRNEKENFWIIAPKDNLKGGTWIGFNSEGIIVAISNLSSPKIEDENKKRSRGLLCFDILSLGDIDDIKRKIEDNIQNNRYEGFNLLVSSKKESFVAVHSSSCRIIDLDPGVYVFTNSTPYDPDKKAEKVKKYLPSHSSFNSNSWIEKMKKILSIHNPEICVHKENEGTTSSSIISVNRLDISSSNYIFANGKPCRNNYSEVF